MNSKAVKRYYLISKAEGIVLGYRFNCGGIVTNREGAKNNGMKNARQMKSYRQVRKLVMIT